MCINSTSLFYGIAVRTWTLARAVDAWPSLEPAFLFFNLVSLRLRLGTLSVSSASSKTSAVERVPVEVWELMKEELVDLELAEAEKALIEEFCCKCKYWDPETDGQDLTTRDNEREQQSRFRVLTLDEVDPSWMMCTTCVTDW
ncbi:hypothetical protein JCM8547_002289 [Rhodosporidiobolus lusitaniae]